MQRTGRVSRRSSSLLQPFLVLALLCSMASSHAASEPEHDWLEVTRDDDQGVELVLRAPHYERTGATIEVPGFVTLGEPGRPQFYERAVRVAVPGGAGARIEIFSQETEELFGVEPRITPELLPRELRRTAQEPGHEWREIPALPWQGRYPSEVVSASGVSSARGRDFITLSFVPLAFDARGGATYTRVVRVRVTFKDPAVLSVSPPTEVEVFHRGMLNEGTAARWQLNLARREGARESFIGRLPGKAFQLPTERLRIRIRKSGIYQLGYSDLNAAGVPVEDPMFDPRTLRLFFDSWHPIPLFADSTPSSWEPAYEMEESALWVQGEADGSFTPGDRVVFYALGPQEYVELVGTSSDSLEYRQHPYDRNNYAWLTWGGQPGLRMQVLSSAAPEPLTAPLVTHATHRVHFEEDRVFSTVDDLWFWEEVRENRPSITGFTLDLGGETVADGELRLAVGARLFARVHAFDVRVNDDIFPTSVWWQGISRPENQYFTYPVRLRSTNELQIDRNFDPVSPPDPPGGPLVVPDGETLFLKFDVAWQRLLAVVTGTGGLAWSVRPAVDEQVYELAGFGPVAPTVLDVTDPARPVRLSDPTAHVRDNTTFWRVRHGRGPGVRTHYQAASAPQPLGSADLQLRQVEDLRDRTTAPDMLIITHESLRSEAQRLADHRRTRMAGIPDAEILVMDVGQVYDNFSGGRMDPLALRNYVKYLYDLDSSPRLQFLMLFGEATHDPRRLLPGTTATLVPTVIAWYADPRVRRNYAVDDWIVERDTPGLSSTFSAVYPVPDLAVGRITPRSAAEAARIVDKIIGYDLLQDYGAWRTRVILTADDECSPRNGCVEAFHIVNTEKLVALTPPQFDIEKIYLTEYPRTLGQKPLGRNAFIRAWSEGGQIINYQGHGAARQIADEVLFLASDIPSLANGMRLPVFMAFSCTVSEFDDPELQCMSEDMLTSVRGGAVATMGATTPTFATPNAQFNEEVFQALYVDGAVSKVPLGLVFQQAKNNSPEGSGHDNETYVLLGDPSMTLLTPELMATFTVGKDSLEAGRTAHIEGIVHLPDSTGALPTFNGTADVEVFSSADESGYTSTDNPNFKLSYDLPGAPLYRGTVDVQAGRFDFEFFVPVDARLGEKARLSCYAHESGLDAKGAIGTVRLVVATEPEGSAGAPQITLRFPNNRTKVKAGAPLIGEIRDENGVNIQGTTLRSSIFLDFDGKNEPLNVTSLFRYEAGSATLGSVTVPLPDDLEPGGHSATLIASDNLQNTSTANIDFEVVDEAVVRLVNVIAFPNPFKDRTYFFFELTDPADVTVRVFTSAGREVWRAQRSFDEATQGSVRWEGIDKAMDELANGTYIYRVEARPKRRGAPRLDSTGKVVIMRD